jgi:hypothetical protein
LEKIDFIITCISKEEIKRNLIKLIKNKKIMGPTTLLGITCASLDHCFVLKIFLEFFKIHLSKKH